MHQNTYALERKGARRYEKHFDVKKTLGLEKITTRRSFVRSKNQVQLDLNQNNQRCYVIR